MAPVQRAQHLEAGERPIERLIAVECPPLASHWLEECGDLGVALAWRDTFDVMTESAPELRA